MSTTHKLKISWFPCANNMKPKSNNPYKILKWISREEQFKRNGGGQFVATNRKYKDKSKYDRKQNKKEMRNIRISFSFFLGGVI